MLSLEEYITKRKKADRINEFDLASKKQNMQMFKNYVTDYFNEYLDESELQEKHKRLVKYKQTLRPYDAEIQEWLADIYEKHDRKLTLSVNKIPRRHDLFYLYHTEKEFKNAADAYYAEVIENYPFLNGQQAMLVRLIKDYHRIKSEPGDDFNNNYITEEIQEWMNTTWDNYQVNLLQFASDYCSRFFDHPGAWDATHTISTPGASRAYAYDYKQNSNLFNINSLYQKAADKPFISGKKQNLEMLLMYCWLHDIVGDEEGYWQEYISRVLPRE